MSRRLSSHATTLLLAGLILAASAVPALGAGGSPAIGAGGSGGGGLGPAPNTGSGTPSDSTTQPIGPAGVANVQASGHGITFTTRAAALLRSRVRFSGQVSGAAVNEVVEIERRGKQTHGEWAPTAHGTVAPDGTFSANWPTNHIGRFSIRAVLQSTRASASRAGIASPALTITVYRPAIATTYGSGFWGSRTACGETLHHSTLGLANRTLPCGTPVSLLWHGRTIVVPVIDRGPYANNADWDLTSATAAALGITGTETIGAVSLPR